MVSQEDAHLDNVVTRLDNLKGLSSMRRGRGLHRDVDETTLTQSTELQSSFLLQGW